MRGPGKLLEGVGVGYQTVYLPAEVTQVPRDVIRAFSHNKRVGTYLLGRSLGEGSFAKVKEALHLPTGEKVAVKVIDKKRAKADPYVRKNLRREGRLLQQIRHQHVVQLLEVLETEHCYYLVTEHCAGGDLMDYIAKQKRLEECEVKKFIRQIVSAVDYLHRLGIIHRDLKIENLLLDQNKDIKLIDFGLSNTIKVTAAPEGTAHAQEYLVTQCGSPAYAAPELLNHRKYGLQVDIWSIGINMYAMLTGSLPFTVEPFNIKTLHNKMITGQMNPMPEHLSREGKDILRKLLAPDPDQRLTIAEALRHPWLSEGRNKPMERHPFPNKLRTNDLDTDILKHMSDNLGFRMSEIIRFVVGNIPSSACSTYHLFHRRLQRHLAAQLRAQGKAPAEVKHMEPTRVSLVLQDMTPGITNAGVSTRPLRKRVDSFEKDAVTTLRDVHNGQRNWSTDQGRRVNTTPSTDKDSNVGRQEKSIMSSQDYNQQDADHTQQMKENRRRENSTPPSCQADIALTPVNASQLPTSRGGTSHKADYCTPTTRQPKYAADAKPPSVPSPATTHVLYNPARKGRVLISLSKTFIPLKRGAGIQGGLEGLPLPHAAAVNHSSKDRGDPRADRNRIFRATHPTGYINRSPAAAAAAPLINGPLSRQPPVVKRLANAQWRSAAYKTEAVHAGVKKLTPEEGVVIQGLNCVGGGKRPVSPLSTHRLVRRRLVKRCRGQAAGATADWEGAQDMRVDAEREQNPAEEVQSVQAETLLTLCPEPVCQSESLSMARDLKVLPAISSVFTPRH